ncbi:MAG: peptidoglycan DD-metalloendopeptidase family protein [Chloroflexi bacterium]|nr:peptidoglycan DD-metalloendopeptidase family protein [Chloroflexota bacterium]MCI0580286.1 peptidoglycan DD-metalloendopeptidase family protein [Chloroflexota bacterium]MCI0643697.1 peptidoglycan DD-metalloendopeptidase family protein [Chloroflexota bacterium]MCI0729081.1 peptidoglycan DD-metalloendopeptidase family protein [Chloroflexota bacterium]
MRFRRSLVAGLLLLLFIPLTWLAWQARLEGRPAETPPTLVAAAAVRAPTPTLAATAAPSPLPTLTLQPAQTLELATPTRPTDPPTATATATTTPIPVDRTCPDPPPPKPEYERYYLNGQAWPTLDPAAGAHFWMAAPLALEAGGQENGGENGEARGPDRLRITEWFPYGYDANGRYLLHNGVDVAEPQGTLLLAVADGTVVTAGDDATALYGWRCDWYGHLVVIELDQRWRGQPVYALYGHVLGIAVAVGQRVTRGQPVAEIGLGGAAVLPHLHFEVRIGTNEFGSTRNPLLWLVPNLGRGVIAGRLVDPEGRPWQGVVISAVGRSEGTSSRSTWTYLDDPQHTIKPDEGYAENFVMGDVPPGRYQLYVSLQGVQYTAEVEVKAAQVSTIEIVTEPYKTPTPTPPPTAGLSPTPTLLLTPDPLPTSPPLPEAGG